MHSGTCWARFPKALDTWFFGHLQFANFFHVNTHFDIFEVLGVKIEMGNIFVNCNCILYIAWIYANFAMWNVTLFLSMLVVNLEMGNIFVNCICILYIAQISVNFAMWKVTCGLKIQHLFLFMGRVQWTNFYLPSFLMV